MCCDFSFLSKKKKKQNKKPKKRIPFLLLAKTPFLCFPQLQNSQVNLQFLYSYLKLISVRLQIPGPYQRCAYQSH